MLENEKFSVQSRIKSFTFAFEGLKTFFVKEHNARIHLLCAFLVLVLGVVFGLSPLEWVALIFAIAFVITTELINTSIEAIADFISPEWHKAIKTIKDLAAGAVLIAALSAATIGGIIFLPKIYSLL